MRLVRLTGWPELSFVAYRISSTTSCAGSNEYEEEMP